MSSIKMKYDTLYRKSFWLFILIFVSFSGTSQTLNINQFGIDEGLPQSTISCMVQDKEGNIWIGTMNGVSKYNGLIFENFGKKEGLAENRVTASFIDKKGNIWFGHWSGGITKYDVTLKKLIEVVPKNIKILNNITCITSDQEDNIWFGTNGEGLLKYKDGTFTSITTKNGLASNEINALICNKNGTLWIGSSKGITLYKTTFFPFDKELPSNSIKSFLLDSKNNIWIGTSDQGLIKVNAAGEIAQIYNTTHGLANNYIKSIYETQDGIIFIGTYGGGVSKYLPQLEANNYAGAIFQTISTQQGLSNDRVLSIIQDREKNIWIGTLLNLNQYFDEQFEIYGENEGLSNSLVWSVIQSKNNNFWVGTEGGLFEFIPNFFNEKNSKELNTNQSTPYRFKQYTGKNGEILNTSALYEDKNGNIWYTDFGQGLSRLNPSTGAITKYTTLNSTIPVDNIYCIAGDYNDNIWIGTNKGGLLKFDPTTETFKQFTIEDGIGSNQIYTIFCDSKNRVWLGCLSGDLTMFDPSKFSKSNTSSVKTFSKKDGYPDKFTLCITEDTKGGIWFGTFSSGIYKYDGKSFKNYTAKDGLSSYTPFILTCDNKNNLWIGNGRGIDKFNLKNETFKHYEKDDGFLGVEFNPNATCKDTEGNLWFGSIIGLVKHTSKQEENNLIEPITSIKAPRIFFQETEIPLDHIFSWDQNHFTFDFIGTSLTNPKRVKYRYYLNGVDEDWSPIVKSNSVTYPNLDPGKYTFKVRSCNNDGIWNKEPVTFSFEIKPPFWKTTWFYIVIISSTFLGIVVFIKSREKILRAQNIALEEKVTQRTEVITKQKSEIEKKNTVITDSIEYAKNIQLSILPTAEDLNKIFHDYFILYKPKDIVSGDFYWMYETDERILFAVADCTGHGVPGAFMSIMGYNLLNDVIDENIKASPAEILDNLNLKILNSLNQKADNLSAKYGMDISIISINKKMDALDFAGAHNPLLIFRNSELFELKADRRSIGTFHKLKTGFTNNSFQLKKGDMLYLFSDGYTDQIGGPENKKYFSKPFRALLQSVNKKNMTEQKNILEKTTDSWKGDNNQTDDIIIVGIRV